LNYCIIHSTKRRRKPTEAKTENTKEEEEDGGWDVEVMHNYIML
jgi:hypothetical protein